MLKIAIYDSNHDNACMVFETAKAILSKSKLRCELSYFTDLSKLMSRLEGDGNLYDALFLNISEKASVKIASVLRKNNYKASLIFVGDEDSPLEDMLRFRPSGIIKDIKNQMKMLDALKVIYAEHKRLHPYLTVKSRDEIRQIEFDDIIYLESSQRIVSVYTKKQVIKFYAKLNDVFSKLPQDRFIRCHQSFAVNMACVKSINKVDHFLELFEGDIIEISKSLYSNVIKEFENYAKSAE